MPTKKPTEPRKDVIHADAQYTNNPLKIAVEGAKSLFQKAPMIALSLAILSGAMASNTTFTPPTARTESGMPITDPALEPVIIGIIIVLGILLLVGALVIGSILVGISSYTAVEVAKGREVSFKVAARATFDRLWSFIWLQLLTGIKVFLWSLLFIVPGIIMAVRYSLANLSFFDSNKKLTGNAALKDSVALTKGAWLTTFASQILLDLITLGTVTYIAETGSRAMLYRQLNALHGTQKPKPHILSWVTLGVMVLIAILTIAFLGYALVNFALATVGL